MLKDLKTYILENDFRVNFVQGKINIVNYTSIDHFDVDKIVIRHSEGVVIVKGESLIITKLLGDEMLISGKIKNLEFG